MYFSSHLYRSLYFWWHLLCTNMWYNTYDQILKKSLKTSCWTNILVTTQDSFLHVVILLILNTYWLGIRQWEKIEFEVEPITICISVKYHSIPLHRVMEETSAHIPCECEALASLRHAHLGSFLLESKDIQSISLGAICSFSNASGLPRLDMGHKGSVYKA
jgi:hypothetical protein